METRGSVSHSQGLSNNPYPKQNQSSFEALCDVSKQIILQCETVILTPNPQTGGPLLIGCPLLFIQYIRS